MPKSFWTTYYNENYQQINNQYANAVQGKVITKDLYTCVCGSVVRFTTLKKHLCSIKHINFTTCGEQDKSINQKTNN